MMLLKTYLAQKKLTDTAFAALLGINQATITRYQHGRFPNIGMIVEIQKATGGQVKANDHVKAYCEFHGIEIDAG